ncbi:hypothetical protein JRO89_XS02G0039800 [Xanthoceras sorbifolium]|uniref:AAA+ ATPase domain-containing protein n=1 Tax=Xanthoceras sorbifolium TaxID=99658 RepID=A0ABQ8IEE5_9ROSI|nr:hypothetical protein JRO89_XS02G0039800 [Xanthoceras sorbifolium]
MASVKSMFLNSRQMPYTKTLVSAAASAAAIAMLVRTTAREFLPCEVRSYFLLKFKNFIASFSSELTLVIEDTFNTLALDLDAKKIIMEDLERFVKRKEFYRRVGKAWKRGYLLYGPPGTGKSSLIAAMANYLHFNIYDLELTALRGNNELRRLLIATENRSILVVEDIDCSIELQDRLAAEARAAAISMTPNRDKPGSNQGTKVNLSGLLNFIDGLWSSCGDERIIVFTTNHKERLDPALLRPGRMDVHIHMSYCTPCGLKMLASNYLRITEHPLLLEIEELIEQVKVTPAEVAEQLMRDEVPEIALSGLIEFFKSKKTENDESKTSGSEILVELEA